MKALISALLLTSCAGAPVVCTTTCGLRLMDPAPWSCEAFQATETRTLAAFDVGVTYDPRFRKIYSCGALSGYDVYVHDGESFTVPQLPGRELAGATYCHERRVIIATKVVPGDSALGHELGHVIQGCKPMISDVDDPDHAGWDEHGINAAIEAAQ